MYVILWPHPLIGNFSRCIEKLSITLHSVECPLALVIPTILKLVPTKAMSETAKSLSFIAGLLFCFGLIVYCLFSHKAILHIVALVLRNLYLSGCCMFYMFVFLRRPITSGWCLNFSGYLADSIFLKHGLQLSVFYNSIAGNGYDLIFIKIKLIFWFLWIAGFVRAVRWFSLNDFWFNNEGINLWLLIQDWSGW
jgi:hypothetical protein